MTLSVSGSQITFPDASTQSTSPFVGGLGFRNRIINGDFRIDQRNAGASVAVATTAVFGVDRWSGQVIGSATGRFSTQRSTTVPTSGFVNSTVVTVTTADASPSSGYGYGIEQVIEGNNIADLNWGTTSASPVSVSFCVRSSVTGTFGVILENYSGALSYCATYTIAAANTWQYVTLTIPGPTSGTWNTDNSGGVHVVFGLGGGTSRTASSNNAWVSSSGFLLTNANSGTNLMATNGATFYITGVQLEKGSTATSFDYRPYGTELALCQRYLPAFNVASGETVGSFAPISSSVGQAIISLPVQARVSPTGIVSNSNWIMSSYGTGSTPQGALTFQAGSPYTVLVRASGATTFVAGQYGQVFASGGAGQFYCTGCEL